MGQKHTNTRKVTKEAERLQYSLVDFFKTLLVAEVTEIWGTVFWVNACGKKKFYRGMIERILVLNILIHESINIQNITLVADYFLYYIWLST